MTVPTRSVRGVTVPTRSVRGVAVSELGLGTAQLGNLYAPIADETASSAIDAAWELGIRHFDTAPHYGLGLSERRLGAALSGRPRDAYVLSTKVGRVLVPSPETAHRTDDQGFAVPADHRRVWDFSRDGILRSLEDSLTRLGTDRIDVVYLHDPDEHLEQAITEGVGALVELREQGVVGAVGAGMNRAAPLADIVRRSDVDVVMAAGRYTLLDRSAEDELLPRAEARGVAVIAAAPYNSGLLSSDVVPDAAMFDYGPAPTSVIARARALADVCRVHGVTLPSAAVRFALRHPSVAAVMVGAGTPEHVASAVERYRADVPDALWADLG